MNSNPAHIDFHLVGIGDHTKPQLSEEVYTLINKTTVFSGGNRHYELMQPALPKNHSWIPIAGKMDTVIQSYRSTPSAIVIFVSGDPFFYGFGNTLRNHLPKATIKSVPYFNSIQRLCQKTQTTSNNLKAVSVHGRDWSALNAALINSEDLIGVLTDGKKTPAVIAKRLLQYNFDNYKIIIGEALDSDNESISTHRLIDCAVLEHDALNCVLLQKTNAKQKGFGLPDDEFRSLDNRPNMITKAPIRLSTLSALQLSTATTFWDIGSCTGSVAIEAKNQYPELKVIAFEKREECQLIIQQNKEYFSVPGIEVVIDDFFHLNLSEYPSPDVVFIGGHGNRLEEMIQKINKLNPLARIVTNAVKESSSTAFVKELTALEYTINTDTLKVNEHNKISIHTAVKI